MSEAQSTYKTAKANAEAARNTYGITSNEYAEARLLETEARDNLLKWSHDLVAGRDKQVDNLFTLAARRPLIRNKLVEMAMEVAA